MRDTNAKPIQSRPRGVHIHLRDGDIVDGGIYLTNGQSLAPYLASRKSGWLNMVDAVWLREGELHSHAVLQTDRVQIAWSSNRDFPVIPPVQNVVPRPVDILLEDGTRIRGNLQIGERQRMSDYLAGCGSFFALLDAARVQDGEPLGDIAVNSDCVKAVRDTKVAIAAAPAVVGRTREGWSDARRTPAFGSDVPTPASA